MDQERQWRCAIGPVDSGWQRAFRRPCRYYSRTKTGTTRTTRYQLCSYRSAATPGLVPLALGALQQQLLLYCYCYCYTTTPTTILLPTTTTILLLLLRGGRRLLVVLVLILVVDDYNDDDDY